MGFILRVRLASLAGAAAAAAGGYFLYKDYKVAHDSAALKDELLQNNLELENSKDKIKEQKEKIKLNKWLPYLVGSIGEVPVAVLTDMLLHKGFSLAPYMRLS